MEILNASKIRDLLFPIYSSVGLRYQPGSVFQLVITLQHAVMGIANVWNCRSINCNCCQLPSWQLQLFATASLVIETVSN